MNDVAVLREQLAEARERIRWLEDAIIPPSQHFDLRLPLAEATILHGLRTSGGPLSQQRLALRLDVALRRPEPVMLKSIEVWICRLRAKLRGLEPPVTVHFAKGRGYWMDDAGKAALETLRIGDK